MTYPPPSPGGAGYGVPPPGSVPGVHVPPQIASVGSRFGALLIDGLVAFALIIVAVVPAALLGGVNEVLGAIAGLVALVVYLVVLFGLPIYTEGGPAARSIGKNAMGVRVVRVDGGRMTYGTAAGRHLSKLFLSGFFYLGYLWALFHDDRRTWHDLIAGTGVVVAPKQPIGELFRR